MAPSVRDPEFYLSHSAYVRALARSLVFDAQAVEDVSQETWLAALRNPPRDASSPRRWLKALVRNLALGAWRRKRLRDEYETSAPAREPVSTPDEVVEHESARRKVVAALLELEEPYRSVLVLRYFDGLEPHEIAHRLGLPVETVRTRVKRALERLRTRMRRDGAWSVLLVRQFKLEPPSELVALQRALEGMVVMGISKKVAAVAALVALLGAALWWSNHGAEAAREDAVAATSTGELARASESAPVADVAQAEREASASTPSIVPLAAQPSSATPTTGSLLLRALWAEDRSPAAGVAFNVGSTAFQSFAQQSIDVRTGPDGTARVDGLPAALAILYIDRGGSESARITAGEVTELTLEIAAGYDVEGLVRDVDGRPFAGAEVLLACMSGSRHVVARTRADGTFSIRDVAADTMLACLYAVAPDREPSAPKRIQGVVGTKVEVELAFAADGGALRGRVVDEHGAPLPRAVVLLGHEGFELEVTRNGQAKVMPARRTIAAEDGSFAFESVAGGSQPLQACALGFVAWRGEVEIVPRSTTSTEVALQLGARVEGIVRDGAGRPVRAQLRVGRWGFASLDKTTGVDGAYAFEGLPPSGFEIRASADGVGTASASLVGASSLTLRWDPVLSSGRTLRGRIVPRDGKQQAWSVDAISIDLDQAPYMQSVQAEDGRFELINCPDALLRIDVRSPTSGQFPLARVENVDPSGPELVIETDPALEPSATLRGRVLDPAGTPVAVMQMYALRSLDGLGVGLRTDPATGRFESERVPPGEWKLLAAVEGFARLQTSPRLVAADQVLDFGDLVLQRGASLAVRVRSSNERTLEDPFLLVTSTHGTSESARLVDGVARFEHVAAGRYYMVPFAEGIALRATEVEVRDGEQVSAEIELLAGTAVHARIADADGRALERGIVVYELSDAEGRLLRNGVLNASAQALEWTGSLVAGRYRLTAHDLGARRGELDFEVPAAPPEPVEVALRLR